MATRISNSAYIHYSYDHFGGAGLSGFYNQKDNLLRQQLAASVLAETSMNRSVPSNADGLSEIVRLITSSADPLQAMLAAGGLNEGAQITTGTKIGMSKAKTLTFGQAAGRFNSLAVGSDIQKWLDLANEYGQGLEKIVNTIALELAGSPAQAMILRRYAKGETISGDDAAILKGILNGMGLVTTRPRDYQRLISGLQRLEQQIDLLASIGGAGSPGGAKKLLTRIAGASAGAIEQVGSLTGEVAVALGGLVAQRDAQNMFRKLDKNLQISSRQVGNVYIDAHQKSGDLQSFLNDNNIALLGNLTGVQQKADAVFTFSNDTASFRFGASVKRTTPDSLRKYGLKLLDTSWLVLLDRMGVFGNQEMLTALMNAAAAHSRESNPKKDFKIQTPEAVASQNWNEVKNIVAINSLYYALAGINKDQSTTMFLIVNNKVYLISDIVKKVLENPDLVSLGQKWNIRRSKFTALNSYLPKGSPMDRSQAARARIINIWASQKAKVTFDFFKAYLS